MSKTIIGVMGPGKGASNDDRETAYQLGEQIAHQGWVLLTGGRKVGVMNAASQGAYEAGGLTVGILPSENKTGMSKFIDIPIFTGMGSARNNINVLSSDIVLACGTGAGTTSEIMLALKAQKTVILLNPSKRLTTFLDELPYPKPKISRSVDNVILLIKEII